MPLSPCSMVSTPASAARCIPSAVPACAATARPLLRGWCAPHAHCAGAKASSPEQRPDTVRTKPIDDAAAAGPPWWEEGKEYQGIPCGAIMSFMKIGVSLPEGLVAFADKAARREGTSRSELLARLLEAERVRQQTEEYLDRHGWDVVDDEAAWRRYQRRRMSEEYRDDEW